MFPDHHLTAALLQPHQSPTESASQAAGGVSRSPARRICLISLPSRPWDGQGRKVLARVGWQAGSGGPIETGHAGGTHMGWRLANGDFLAGLDS